MSAISAISSSNVSSILTQQYAAQQTTLTDEDKSTLSDILAKYDPENMTEEDVKSLMDEIREAGIRPSEDLKSTLEDAGFEIKPPQGPPPGPPPEGMGGMQRASGEEPPDYVKEFLDKVKNGDVTEDDVTAFLAAVEADKQNSTGVIVDEQG